MAFIALTQRRQPKGHITIDCKRIVAIEDNSFNTSVKDFIWTNVWLTNGLKLEVLESEQKILDMISRVC